MPVKPQPRRVYWDSCVFLAYLNKEPNRAELIQAVWDEVAEDDDPNSKIITSVVTITEVAHADYEKTGKKLDPKVEKILDAMWHDRSVLIIEASPDVMFLARNLMRQVTPTGSVLKPMDAIQLATAQWLHQVNGLTISAFHTYDSRLQQYSALIGITITEPRPVQPRLFPSSPR